MLIPGETFHIYNRSNNYEQIFKNEVNYVFLLQKYRQYINPCFETFAYCLMPTHFHFMVRAKEVEELNLLQNSWRNFLISYAKSYNKFYHRHGSVFQKKLKIKPVIDETHFTELVTYIHLNPVKARLVASPANWKFSSYNALLSENETLINREEVIEWFGGKSLFIKFHKDIMNRDGFSAPEEDLPSLLH